MGGQFSGKSRSTDMHALPAVAITATVMLPFMFCQSLQQVCASREWVSCLCCCAFPMYGCICIYIYMYMSIIIYMRNYAHMTGSITYWFCWFLYYRIHFVLILPVSLLQNRFRIDSVGFFTTESISYWFCWFLYYRIHFVFILSDSLIQTARLRGHPGRPTGGPENSFTEKHMTGSVLTRWTLHSKPEAVIGEGVWGRGVVERLAGAGGWRIFSFSLVFLSFSWLFLVFSWLFLAFSWLFPGFSWLFPGFFLAFSWLFSWLCPGFSWLFPGFFLVSLAFPGFS